MVLALIGGVVLLATSGGDDEPAAAGPGEIFLEPVSSTGQDPFSPSVAEPPPSSTIPPDEPVPLGNGDEAPTFPTNPPDPDDEDDATAITAMDGGTPGLYGGTLDQASCDKQQMIDFLAANQAEAQAWADVQSIPVTEVGTYVDGLTPVLLRGDTRVTNHGFVDGRATPLQYVLQAGTAVLVDEFGVPRARCACGNPLLPPVAAPVEPTYVGTPWTGFNPVNVTVINPSPTVINVITIIDVTTGTPFGRETGPGPGPDQQLPTGGSTTTTTTSTTTTEPSTTTTTEGATGTFTLVDTDFTVAELPDNWTVDADAGTAQVLLEPNSCTYEWSVPPRIRSGKTKITWGGTSVGNCSVAITPNGSGVSFDPSDVEVNDFTAPSKSAVITAAAGVDEVILSYSMGFSVNAVYTYRR